MHAPRGDMILILIRQILSKSLGLGLGATRRSSRLLDCLNDLLQLITMFLISGKLVLCLYNTAWETTASLSGNGEEEQARFGVIILLREVR
jgi:hypothetical protein